MIPLSNTFLHFQTSAMYQEDNLSVNERSSRAIINLCLAYCSRRSQKSSAGLVYHVGI